MVMNGRTLAEVFAWLRAARSAALAAIACRFGPMVVLWPQNSYKVLSGPNTLVE
jgi:hypothetical protein